MQPLRFGHRCSAEMLRVVLRKRKMVDDDMVSEYMLLDKFPALPQGDPRKIQQCCLAIIGNSAGDATAQSPGSRIASVPWVMVSP